MGEKLKDPKLELGFLLDRNAEKAAALFSGKRVRTLAAVGLAENATDAQVVRKARELSLTIVTVNGDDFVKEISKFQNQTKENDCHEVFGLVILPDGYENQKRLLQKAGSKLRLGRKKLAWWDVAHKNRCVRIKRSGNPEVNRFPRCFYCRKLELAWRWSLRTFRDRQATALFGITPHAQTIELKLWAWGHPWRICLFRQNLNSHFSSRLSEDRLLLRIHQDPGADAVQGIGVLKIKNNLHLI
jgi:hypothetical protein